MKLFHKVICAFLITTFVMLLGCSKPPTQASPGMTESVPQSDSNELQASPSDSSEESYTSQEVILKYWDAMNSYDLEQTLSYYEENYREQEIEEVTSDISRLKQFGVTLSVKEISEPILISEGMVRHDIVLGTPIGDENLTYLLERIAGEWKILSEDETEEWAQAKEFIIGFLTKYKESQLMDIIINADQKEGIERVIMDITLSDLVKSGEIIEVRAGVYSLPGE